MWGRLVSVGFAAAIAGVASCAFHANGAAPGDGAQPGTDGAGSGTNGSGTGGSGSGMGTGSGTGSGSTGSNGSGGHGSNGSGGGGGALPCPSGYTLTDSAHPGSFYKQVSASVTWSTAEADCESDEVPNVTLPAHLIVLDDLGEGAYAWSRNNSNQWAGHTDTKTEGTWLPVTDQPNTFSGNASGNSSSKDCLEITQSSGQTTAESCTQTRPYLCECDGNAANPANVVGL